MRALFVVGRALFGGFFVYSGINHFQHAGAMTQYADAKGVPAAAEAVKATGALLIASGVSVMAGIKPRQGLAGLVAFLLPTTLKMHRFWEEADGQKRQAESINFMKNVALMGAALTMMQIDEPWPASVDQARAAADEEMFIHLGGRDLRSLPA
jgi:putative oxidoreductase